MPHPDLKPVTLRNVASAAGVHIATASAVLNGSRGSTRVSDSTRAKVLEAARKLGYVRNESASHLRTGTSAAVGFIGGDLRNPFFAELVAELEKALARKNCQLAVSHVASDDQESFQSAVKLMRGQALRSIIYWDELGRTLPPEILGRQGMLPIGFTARPRDGVWLDLEHAIRKSVEHLITLGHRKLGFFAPALRGESPSVQARWYLFQKECTARGLPEPKLVSYNGESWDIEAAAAEGRKLRNDRTISAYLGFNDTAALGLLLARTPKVHPEVLCFDGTSLVRFWPSRPPYLDLKLSSLAQLAVAVQAGEKDPRISGKHTNWLRPTVVLGGDRV